MARKNIAVLTEEEIELIQKGSENADYITDYFFRQKGSSQGWIFDYNFDPEGAWQRMVHHASQRRVLVIGGFASGKTRGVGISACAWAISVPDFMFMNAAPYAWQSELMYKFILQVSRGTPFERLIYSFPKRPYPVIELRFIVRGMMMISTLEFMSVEKNANSILGWEGDWANIDEAGQLDDLGGAITALGSRMRGSINGRARLGRLSMISNSWDNIELWYRYDLAAELPEDYLSLTVSSRYNHNVTDDQLRLMLKDIPEDEHDRFIEGARPEGRGNYFNKNRIYACEDPGYGDYILAGVKEGIDGFEIAKLHGAGVVFFTTPAVQGRSYMVLADPGVGNAPNRNAPVIQVWDVTDFPKYKATLAALWWGSGNGSITPFINRLLRFMETYNPIFTGADSTGTQKNTNTLLNTFLKGKRADPEQINQWLDIDIEKVTNLNIAGMDFSGSRKPAYLVAGRLMIEAELLAWPKWVIGMRSQLSNYDPEKDRSDATSKIPQDLVATTCMAAHSIRQWFAFDPNLLLQKAQNQYHEQFGEMVERQARLSGDGRSIRSGRA